MFAGNRSKEISTIEEKHGAAAVCAAVYAAATVHFYFYV
jgi:hypothetical protein